MPRTLNTHYVYPGHLNLFLSESMANEKFGADETDGLLFQMRKSSIQTLLSCSKFWNISLTLLSNSPGAEEAQQMVPKIIIYGFVNFFWILMEWGCF